MNLHLPEHGLARICTIYIHTYIHTYIVYVQTPKFNSYKFDSSNVTDVVVPVTVRSKAQVFGRSPAEIVGSDPAGGHGCLSVVSVVCCLVEVSATD
jgi:hypothetical protein